MPDITELFDSGKKLIIAVCAVIAVFIAGVFGLRVYRNVTADKTPVVSISATDDKVYAAADEIQPTDFAITAKHKDGGTTSYTGDSTIKLSRKHVPNHGKYATVKLTTKDGLTCTTKVKCKRDKIISFNCAKYKKDNVKATLYSNGELAFEGSGEIAGFSDNSGPWNGDYDSKDTNITSVTFGKNVRIVDGSKLFSGRDQLTYVGKLPATLVSANEMFSGCVALKKAPDMSGCAVLKDMTSAFSGCTALTDAGTIPSSVITTAQAFNGCTAITKAASFEAGSQDTDVTSMYQGCTALTDPGRVPSKVNEMASAYAGCINLSRMPNIPGSVSDMNNAFTGCRLLKKFTTIPSGVENISGCFNGCTYMSGTIRIDANAQEYDGLFAGAATATKVNLVGKSKRLHYYAFTSENPKRHIYVRGKAAVKPKDMM